MPAEIAGLADGMWQRALKLAAEAAVFNNKTFKATLPNRDLDGLFTAQMKTTIAASGKVKGDVAILITPALEIESPIAAAREQGFFGRTNNRTPGGHPNSSTRGRFKLLHPDAVNRRRSAPS
jgi:hypothetical protein